VEEDIKVLEELRNDMYIGISGWVDRLDKREKEALDNLINFCKQVMSGEAFQVILREEEWKSKIDEKIKELEIDKLNCSDDVYKTQLIEFKINLLKEIRRE